MEVLVSREAADELEKSAEWYEQEAPGLGRQLINAFEAAVALLRNPNPPLIGLSGEAATLGARRLILRRFPYSLIVINRNDSVIIVAFAHQARRPEYWKDRV